MQRQHLTGRRVELHDVLTSAVATLKSQQAALDSAQQDPAVMDEETRSALDDLRRQFTADALKPMQDAESMTSDSHSEELEAQQANLLERISAADAALVRLAPDFQDLGRRLDEAFYSALSDEDRKAVDSFAHLSRADLARAILLHRPVSTRSAGAAPGSLLERLESQYNVRLYVFACRPTEASADDWRRTSSPRGRARPT